MTSTDPEVTIYYGPLSWFHQQIGTEPTQNLVELTYEMDDLSRQIKIVQPGVDEDSEKPKDPRPKRVVAESSDYASLREHVISNFAGFVRKLNPEQLFLHNPPVRVHEQLQRTVRGTSVERFDYPTVSLQTLVDFRDGFSGHLVGQHDVQQNVLAAMYPLTRPARSRPVVLMFFGPSGVGKTETAQFINGLLGGKLMRKQFSMFHSEKFASYLFGGDHSEASLARDLLDRESGVILIDEFDKANSVFHSAFYQLFDGGEFEDKNYNVKVGPALIICTSNYGSESEISDALGDALLSRFDALIEFDHLSVDETMQVIERLVDHQLSTMEPEERAKLDRPGLVEMFTRVAEKATNVRRLSKLVEQTMSLMLVRATLQAPAALSAAAVPVDGSLADVDSTRAPIPPGPSALSKDAEQK